MAATIDQLRRLVQDNTVPYVLEDDDYQVFIDLESNVYRAAAAAARALSAVYASKVSLTAGPVKLENTQKFDHYNELANRFDQRAREGGGSTEGGSVGTGIILTGVSVSAVDDAKDDTDRVSSIFERDMDSYLTSYETSDGD